jgi:hypothetical protein
MADKHSFGSPAEMPAGGARNFDFLIGHWRILNRRLTERLAGADTWDTFEATLSVRPILGGLGNVDEFKVEGTPVLARFIWSEITDRSARWEQAFSTDDGRT